MSEAPPVPLLTPGQRRIVGFALTLAALLGTATLIVLAVVVLGRLLDYFSGVLWPVAVAGVLALILRPVVDAVEKKLRLRRPAAVTLLYGLFALAAGAALLLLLPPLVSQMIDAVTYLPDFGRTAWRYIEQHSPHWVELARVQLANPTVRKLAEKFAAELQDLLPAALPSLRAAGGGVLGVFPFTAHVAIVPVYLFFFLLSTGDPTRQLRGHLPFLKESVRDDIVYLVREFIGIVESFFRGQLVISLIMGVLLALGFSIVGLKFGLFLGLALGVLNIVPYLGTIIGLAVAVPLAFFQPGGGWQLIGLVLLVKGLVQTLEGWFLTPRIMGERTGLHPAAIIFAVFFWGTALDGLFGMLLAIPLTAFFVTAWRYAKRNYFSA